MTDRLEVEFKSAITVANNCICNACHGTGRVIKLRLPATYYREGGELATLYDNYWLCRSCRDKLAKALEKGVQI